MATPFAAAAGLRPHAATGWQARPRIGSLAAHGAPKSCGESDQRRALLVLRGQCRLSGHRPPPRLARLRRRRSLSRRGAILAVVAASRLRLLLEAADGGVADRAHHTSLR